MQAGVAGVAGVVEVPSPSMACHRDFQNSHSRRLPGFRWGGSGATRRSFCVAALCRGFQVALLPIPLSSIALLSMLGNLERVIDKIENVF